MTQQSQRDPSALAEHFRRFGFVECGPLLEGTLLEEVTVAYEKVVSGTQDAAEPARGLTGITGPRLTWLQRPESTHPDIAPAPLVDKVRRLAAALLGEAEGELVITSRIFYKPPFVGAPIPWHQDAGYRDPDWTGRSLNVWITLDTVTEDGPCLRYIPASHARGLLPHRSVGHDPLEGLVLEAQGVDEDEEVRCGAPAGHATAHDCRTLHASGPNTTPSPRRALVFVCETAR